MNPPQIKRTVAERPILFSAEMVRAILDGRKTQARQAVKVEHAGCGQHVHPAVTAITHREDGWFGFDSSEKLKDQYITTFPFDTIRCPHGVPGDRLWVRETWAESESDGGPVIAYRSGGYLMHGASGEERLGTYVNKTFPGEAGEVYLPERWRPSIFMPRWASRITLEVVSVRAERVQEISHRDALAEGVDYDVSKLDGWPIDRYRATWSSINAKRGFGWDKNPWAWVIEFRRVEP